jgi:hypothetical protein
MFNNCVSLQTIPLINTANGITFSSMFNGCTSLQSVPLLVITAGTTFTAMFGSCWSLAVGKLSGTAQDISYTNCRLSATELNNIYTGLGSGAGKTITVTGNYGTTGDNPATATAKSWTVTGS